MGQVVGVMVQTALRLMGRVCFRARVQGPGVGCWGEG